jgi:hypothetical protein
MLLSTSLTMGCMLADDLFQFECIEDVAADYLPVIESIYDCSYRCPMEAIEESITGKVNYWTMLFNKHAISIANMVMSYLKERLEDIRMPS